METVSRTPGCAGIAGSPAVLMVSTRVNEARPNCRGNAADGTLYNSGQRQTPENLLSLTLRIGNHGNDMLLAWNMAVPSRFP